MSKLRNILIATVLALGLLATQVVPAFACGGLIAPNGAIRLERATTLVAWHEGIEHYMTSFTYQAIDANSVSSLGWLVPLPAVPLKIEEGGAWTFQRLFRETHPFPSAAPEGAALAANKADDVEVLQQTKVQALDITIIRGNGQAVLDWAEKNGFTVDGLTRAHLLVYAQGSPIFMAAKYDTAEAKARKLLQGDGSPVLITMKTPSIWVPIEILALEDQKAEADLYLLTDTPVNTSDLGMKIGVSPVGSEIPGAPGFKIVSQKQLSPQLYKDLSTDRNMNWVQPESWLTYLSLDAPQTAISYDLSVSSNGIIQAAPYGTTPLTAAKSQKAQELSDRLPMLTLVMLPVIIALWSALGILFVRRHISQKKKRAETTTL